MNEMIRGVDVDLLNKAYNELYSAVLEQKKRLGKLLENLDPLEVMLRAVWHSRLLVLLRSGNPDDFDGRDPVDELSCNKANLIPEYLQSCLLFISASGGTSSEDDKAAGRLEEMMSCTELIVDQLNKGVFVRFLDAFITGKEAGMSEGVLDYQIEAMAYQSVRGQRYQAVSEDYLSLLLCKQDSLIRRVYGIGYVEVVEGFGTLMKSLTMGWSEAMQNLETQLEHYQERGCAALDDIAKDEATIIAESVFGHRLHDVLTVTDWPEELIDDLSLPVACTSDVKAFESINPLGLMPVARKPFIRIVGKSYCFCAAKGMRTFLWTGYEASPRLLRYCIGLIQPSFSFGRASL